MSQTDAEPVQASVTLARKPASLPFRVLLAMAESRELTIALLIVLLSGTMAVLYPNNFPTAYNISAILLNASQNAILVTGMMILMIAGRFDLSIGSVLALSGVIAGAAHAWLGLPAGIAFVCGIATGCIAGLVNGLLVTRIGINALIATLATLSIFRGATQMIASNGITPIGDSYKTIGQSFFLGMQTPFWAAAIVAVAGSILVARTRFFRQYYFIGGNPKAAKLSGIANAELTLFAFVLMGGLAGLAGSIVSARLNTASVSAGINVELAVITAAVLGGASLKGGEGSVLGGVLGVVFIGLVQNAFIINGVGTYWQNIMTGLVLILAVSLDHLKHRNTK